MSITERVKSFWKEKKTVIAGMMDLEVNPLVTVIRAIEEIKNMFEVTPSPFIVQYLYGEYPSSIQFKFVNPHVKFRSLFPY